MRAKTLDPTKTGPDVEALERDLRDKIVGQEDAIHEVVEMYQTYVSGLSAPGRPIANLMFLGPTGSGKTRLVEALAECLLQDRAAVLKIDCAEFQHSHGRGCRLLRGTAEAFPSGWSKTFHELPRR